MHLPYPSFSIVVLVTRGFKNSEIVLFNSALPSNNTFAPVKTVKKTVDFSVLSLPDEEFGDGKKKKKKTHDPLQAPFRSTSAKALLVLCTPRHSIPPWARRKHESIREKSDLSMVSYRLFLLLLLLLLRYYRGARRIRG